MPVYPGALASLRSPILCCGHVQCAKAKSNCQVERKQSGSAREFDRTRVLRGFALISTTGRSPSLGGKIAESPLCAGSCKFAGGISRGPRLKRPEAALAWTRDGGASALTVNDFSNSASFGSTLMGVSGLDEIAAKRRPVHDWGGTGPEYPLPPTVVCGNIAERSQRALHHKERPAFRPASPSTL